ncbi:tetratricopeptide repeat protein [Nostoc sp.]|uniref:tetratricopeptide repeat protein n=1 Tax=Nostoc sp. TaxID=1180 RepID=UPI002FFA5A7F
MQYSDNGLAYAGKMEWDKAIKDLNQTLKFNPNYPDAYYNRGLAHAGKMEWDKAIKDLNQTLRFNPNYPDAKQQLQELLKSSLTGTV